MSDLFIHFSSGFHKLDDRSIPSFSKESYAKAKAQTGSRSAAFRKFKAENRLSRAQEELRSSCAVQKQIDELIYVCESNPLGWPGLHWAIEKLKRPDVALEILRLFPEEAHQLTPSTPVWAPVGDGTYNYIKENDPGYSALELAIRNGSETLVENLLKAGSDPNIYRTEHSDFIAWTETSLLGFAIQSKQTKIAKMLLEYGANPFWVRRQNRFREQSAGNWSGFSWALQYYSKEEKEIFGDLIQAQRKAKNKPWKEDLSEADIDLFLRWTCHWPPLFYAFYLGEYEVSKRLLELGAETEDLPFLPQWKEHRPPSLHAMAFQNPDPRFLFLLLEEKLGAEAILLHSIEKGLTELFDRALELKVHSEQAVLRAVQCQNKDALRKLLVNGFPVSDEALRQAIALQDRESVSLFREFSIPFSKEMILFSVEKGMLVSVDLILEQESFSAEEWIQIAARFGQKQIYEELLKRLRPNE